MRQPGLSDVGAYPKAHQRVIREKEATSVSLLGAWWEDVDTSFKKATVERVGPEKASEVILRYEWLGTMPQGIRQCWGLFHDGVLAGAVVFAEKPGSNLTSNATSQVPPDSYYLARGACVHWAHPHAASWFIAQVGKAMSPCSILAYSDPAAGEVGTIYQALGWCYLGPSSGGPTAVKVDGKLMTLRSFKRDRGGGGQSEAAVRTAFPSSSIEMVGRKGRYLGVYGDKRYQRSVRAKLIPQPYPKRTVLGA